MSSSPRRGYSERRLPRVVFVTRPTPLELLKDRFGTLGQVEFYLRTRGHDVGRYWSQFEQQRVAVESVRGALPADRRRVLLDRSELSQFLFVEDDVIVPVGQDGLVANVARFLQGQRVIGVNPAPDRNDGVLCRHTAEEFPAALAWSDGPSSRSVGSFFDERRWLARAQTSDGQEVLALNELFLGHRGHQSARYELAVSGRTEEQSSSGMIVATGTGATGWARSISLQRGIGPLPSPTERSLAWFVREPFPSVSTQVSLDFGVLHSKEILRLRSRMGEGGVIFADGIEVDRVEFLDGETVTVGLSDQSLRLLVPGGDTVPPSSPVRVPRGVAFERL